MLVENKVRLVNKEQLVIKVLSVNKEQRVL